MVKRNNKWSCNPTDFRFGDKARIAKDAGIHTQTFSNILRRVPRQVMPLTALKIAKTCQQYGYRITWTDLALPQHTTCRYFSGEPKGYET